MIEYDKFQKSLKHLELQFNNLETLDDKQPELMKEAVRESVIQRFETCYDSLYKILKKYLTEEMGIPDIPNSPKQIFKIANENNLFSSEISVWLTYANARIDTSHDYNKEKAQAAISLIPDFIDDAIGLYQTMTGNPWE